MLVFQYGSLRKAQKGLSSLGRWRRERKKDRQTEGGSVGRKLRRDKKYSDWAIRSLHRFHLDFAAVGAAIWLEFALIEQIGSRFNALRGT